jgi:hypothetical protein
MDISACKSNSAASFGSATRRGQDLLELDREIIRDQEAQRLAQRLGLGTAEGGLEAPLGVRPKGIGLRELLATVSRKSY